MTKSHRRRRLEYRGDVPDKVRRGTAYCSKVADLDGRKEIEEVLRFVACDTTRGVR